MLMIVLTVAATAGAPTNRRSAEPAEPHYIRTDAGVGYRFLA